MSGKRAKAYCPKCERKSAFRMGQTIQAIEKCHFCGQELPASEIESVKCKFDLKRGKIRIKQIIKRLKL